MITTKIFRIETVTPGYDVIRTYTSVPTSYTLKEKEFLTFLEAKQCLVSQSGQICVDAQAQFDLNLSLVEECCSISNFISEDLRDLAEETTTA